MPGAHTGRGHPAHGRLSETVGFDVAAGRIVGIEGGKEARLLRSWIEQLDDPTMYRIAHVSMGFNPGIPVPTGRVVEDERAFDITGQDVLVDGGTIV